MKMDKKGRIINPVKIGKDKRAKRIRSAAQAKNKALKMGQAESVAEKYGGIVQVAKWPEELDEFIVDEAAKWWKNTK